MKFSILAPALFWLVACANIPEITDANAGKSHLLISEVVYYPEDAQYIELYNPTDKTIDLSRYYIADFWLNSHNAGYTTFYFSLVSSKSPVDRVATSSDFIVNLTFDGGSSPLLIEPGKYLVLAMDSTKFEASYSATKRSKLVKGLSYVEITADGSADGLPDLVIMDDGTAKGLDKSGEPIVLYYWDQQTDLVRDVDIFFTGNSNDLVDKTSQCIDGRDTDKDITCYKQDRASLRPPVVYSTDLVHQAGMSFTRSPLHEASEIFKADSNGITGHDETTENLAQSFIMAAPTPGY